MSHDGDAEDISTLRIRLREADAVVRRAVEALEELRDDIARRLEKAETERRPVVGEIELQLHAIACELRELEVREMPSPTLFDGDR